MNQDSVFVSPERGLFIVADGMGGHQGGETASREAVLRIDEALKDIKPSNDALKQAVIDANASIYDLQSQDSKLRGMGTTLTALWMNGTIAYLAQVGDSRAYLRRGDRLTQLTTDHSLVGELMQAGMLTEAQARVHPYRNIITRALGTEPDILVDTFVRQVQPRDRYLLCSDGLHGVLADARMHALLDCESLENAAEALLAETLEAGAPDNVSIVLVEAVL